MAIRSPIVSILAHVDHGKTSILDAIRGSFVAKKEAGGITQMIGASYVSIEEVEKVGGQFAKKMNIQLKIPGLLFIDTPGHEVFTNLRERGGSIADMAILVIDIMQGVQPQTIESIRILKQYKTPFIVAANKVDLIRGWKEQNTTSFSESLEKQQEYVVQILDEKMYEIMGKLSEYGFDSERFDRIKDFSKQISIIPTSAKTKEGIGELLMMIAGLSQKYLEKTLNIEVNGAAKGSIIEVKGEKGMGTTIDVIIYEGIIRRGEEIMFLTKNGVKSTKVRGLLLPNISPKKPEEKYVNVDQITAAAGVKILAPELEDAIPGSPINVISNFEEDKRTIENQFKEVIFEKEHNGVIVRAESLGSIEAILALLKEKKIPVKDAGVGKITKKEVIEAYSLSQNNKYLGVVFGFNIDVLPEAREEAENLGVPIIWSNIIYKIVENYEEWVRENKEIEKKKMLENLSWPGRIKILEGCCFRMCKPAIFGVEILEGKINVGDKLMNDKGEIVGEIKAMQDKKENIKEAKKGMQIAISSPEINIGKSACEGEKLFVYLTRDEIKLWNDKKEILDDDEKRILAEIEKRVLTKVF
ncbi:MAG: translation initiation factor IF-2 [Candidatus ainarchaeum sp.]|nr:translation initiation factor IF-2 [Candidatus ainarchaeum sp.]